MDYRVTLVTASGPGREVGLERVLADALEGPRGPLCEDAVVGWDTAIGEVPAPLRERWAPKGVEFRPCAWRNQIQLAESVATRDRWVLWLLDDERLAGPGNETYDILARENNWAAEIPTPLSKLLAGASIDVLLAIYAGPGYLFGEPRLWRAGFTWPEHARPMLRLVGNDLQRMLRTAPAVQGLVTYRQRFGPPKGASLRLNIGAGCRWTSGWVNIDRDPADYPDVLLDVSRRTLPYRDNTIGAIVSSHMIDHLDIRRGRLFLGECLRVLKPGTPIRLSSCDLSIFVKKYLDGTLDDFAYFQPSEFSEYESDMAKLGIVACGALADTEWYSGHRQLYDGGSLSEVLRKTGFVGVKVCEENEYDPEFWDTDDIHPDHSVYIQGYKPE